MTDDELFGIAVDLLIDELGNRDRVVQMISEALIELWEIESDKNLAQSRSQVAVERAMQHIFKFLRNPTLRKELFNTRVQ